MNMEIGQKEMGSTQKYTYKKSYGIMPEKHNVMITLTVTKYCNYMLSNSDQKMNVQAITVKHIYIVTLFVFHLQLR
jgi:hypothetical protein